VATAALAFDELPPSGQTEWEATRAREVMFVEEEAVGLPQRFPSLRFGRYSMLRAASPFVQRTTRNHLSIEEKVSCELAELTEKTAVVKTRLVSSWVSEVDGKKAFEFSGTGQYTFDRTQQVIAKGHSQNEIKVNSQGIEANLPFKMAFDLREVVTAEELKVRLAKATARREEAAQQRVTQAIATLKDKSATDLHYPGAGCDGRKCPGGRRVGTLDGHPGLTLSCQSGTRKDGTAGRASRVAAAEIPGARRARRRLPHSGRDRRKKEQGCPGGTLGQSQARRFPVPPGQVGPRQGQRTTRRGSGLGISVFLPCAHPMRRAGGIVRIALHAAAGI